MKHGISIILFCVGGVLGGEIAQGQTSKAVDLTLYQNVRYVSIERGSDITWGGSRQGPWLTLHFALDQITDASSTNRYVILVGQGVYTGVKSTAFTMKPYVDVYGGYEPYSITWSRDIFKYRTVLDGEDTRRVVKAAADSRLDGVYLRCGTFNYPYDVYGGGILFDFAENSVLSNSFLMANNGVNGGAICSKWCSPHIVNCTIKNNAASGGTGGGICCWEESHPIIDSCLIQGNSSLTGGGAVYSRQGSSPVFLNCIIAENSANVGGAVYCLNSSPSFYNCTLADNTASNDGGDFALYSSSLPSLKNCILWNNTPPWSALSSTNTLSLQYCVVPETWTGSATHILSVNPLFVGDGDYHLREGSPCLSQGIGPGADPSIPTYDYDGDTRGGKVCDIGADEHEGDELTRTPAATLSPTITATETFAPTPTVTPQLIVTASPTPSPTRTQTTLPTITPTQEISTRVTPTGTAVLGDLDNDGSIGHSDLLILQALWHKGPKDIGKQSTKRR